MTIDTATLRALLERIKAARYEGVPKAEWADAQAAGFVAFVREVPALLDALETAEARASERACTPAERAAQYRARVRAEVLREAADRTHERHERGVSLTTAEWLRALADETERAR